MSLSAAPRPRAGPPVAEPWVAGGPSSLRRAPGAGHLGPRAEQPTRRPPGPHGHTHKGHSRRSRVSPWGKGWERLLPACCPRPRSGVTRAVALRTPTPASASDAPVRPASAPLRLRRPQLGPRAPQVRVPLRSSPALGDWPVSSHSPGASAAAATHLLSGERRRTGPPHPFCSGHAGKRPGQEAVTHRADRSCTGTTLAGVGFRESARHMHHAHAGRVARPRLCLHVRCMPGRAPLPRRHAEPSDHRKRTGRWVPPRTQPRPASAPSTADHPPRPRRALFTKLHSRGHGGGPTAPRPPLLLAPLGASSTSRREQQTHPAPRPARPLSAQHEAGAGAQGVVGKAAPNQSARLSAREAESLPWPGAARPCHRAAASDSGPGRDPAASLGGRRAAGRGRPAGPRGWPGTAARAERPAAWCRRPRPPAFGTGVNGMGSSKH